jgi:hypothetical protein
MATALLKFDLTDSDDRMEFERVNKSLDMALMLWEVLYNEKKKAYRILEQDKHSTDKEYELVDKIFASINELAEEHNIKIDALIS